MTRKLFWEDPYRTELATTVNAVDGDTVTLAETIFFTLFGGQESDDGTVAGHTVLKADLRGQEIVCTLPPGHGLSPGEPVIVSIDWERRYRLIRLHFAAEIVLELVQQNYGPVAKTGAHISADKARIDFDWDGNIGEVLPALQEKAAAIVAADTPVISAYSDEAAERRFWRVYGFGRSPAAAPIRKPPARWVRCSSNARIPAKAASGSRSRWARKTSPFETLAALVPQDEGFSDLLILRSRRRRRLEG